MALDGFYKVDFSASLPGAGGIVTLEGGKIRGGDANFLYSGSYSEEGGGAVSATVRVKAMHAGALSVFGTHGGAFELKLRGQETQTGFTLSGAGPGGQSFRASGNRVADLNF